MGLRRKISLGFLILGCMLAFSGMISLFELIRMSRNTGVMLENSSDNMAHSKRMLDAIQDQNTALLQMIVLGEKTPSDEFLKGHDEFDAALEEAARAAGGSADLEHIYQAHRNYEVELDNYFKSPAKADIGWYLDMYRTTYQQITTEIKLHMIESQRYLLGQASRLKNNAYRAIMPGILTLCVAILMALMFAYLIDIYYTRPVLQITNSLKGYISNKIPFNIKADGRDEVLRLRQYVEELINLYKNKKGE